ncbi:4916_t:CDS:10 [Ambispora leptoticha]|uniref:4916_t:CDS:1 n=1 Tax=Ambispora leptoticha TaxID=144679 RepID=A0A9N8ZQ78_9GLOM|nr:4916_t:CDS:10 [Ambispora leptoticha]
MKLWTLRLEGRDRPVHVEYTQGTSVQAVLERACRTLGIYDSWNYALYSLLFKSWLCESHLLSSYPAEDTLIVRKKTPQYLELTYNEENPKKRSMPTTSLSPNIQPTKRRGIFSQKTCLKTRYQQETIYLSAILFTSDSKILITSGSRMFPTVEVIRDQRIFGNFETDCEEFSLALRTSLDWTTSTDFDKDDNASDTDSIHSAHSNDGGSNSSNHNNEEYVASEQDSMWARAFGQAVVKLKSELSLDTLGTLYEHVVPMSSSKSKFIVTMQHIPQQFKDDIAPDLIKSGILKWKNFDEASSIYSKEGQPVWTNYIEKWCSRQSKLSPGLYLGVLYTESTLQGIRVLVPKDRKQFIPLEKIRDDANITPEEASWVKSLTCLSPDCFMDLVGAAADDHHSSSHTSSSSTTFGRFQTSFMDSYHKLQLDTNLTWDSHDIYCEQTVDIYLDLQNNQMFTMMGELDDNIEGHNMNTSAFTENTPSSSMNTNNNTHYHQLHSSSSLSRSEKISRKEKRRSLPFMNKSEKRKTAPAILAHAIIPSFSDAPPLPGVHLISLDNDHQNQDHQKERQQQIKNVDIEIQGDIIKNGNQNEIQESCSPKDHTEEEQNKDNEENVKENDAITVDIISITPAAVTQENIKAINESSGQDGSTTSNSNEDEVVTALEEGSAGEMEVGTLELAEPRSKDEEEEEINSAIKTSDSTGGATSIAGETTSTTITSTANGSFNTAANSMKPFIRVILIVKPMRQPHQIREPYRSGLCILYPFHLFDALQHATFNACLYASSRRAMQILQASKVYFTQDLVRYLQSLDNFCEVAEQNVEDYFFEPDDFQNVPEEVRKIQQALEIIKGEINGLKVQWNAVSWSMTVIEWDRQRTMQSYSFGMRPNVYSSTGSGRHGTGSGNGSRAASVYNMKTDESTESDGVSMSATIRPSDTAAQVEYLRDMMLHAPDRAWHQIRAIEAPIPIINADGTSSRPGNNGRSSSSSSSSNNTTRPRLPIGPLLTQFFATSRVLSLNPTTPIINRLSNSSSIEDSSEYSPIPRRQRSSSVSSISSVTSTKSMKSNTPIRKKSAGHRLMRTLGFGNSINSHGSNEQPLPEPPVPQIYSTSSGGISNVNIKDKKATKRNNSKIKKNTIEDNYIFADDGNDNASINNTNITNIDEKISPQQQLPVNQENVVIISTLEPPIATPPPLTPLTPTFIINTKEEQAAEEIKLENSNVNNNGGEELRTNITLLSSSENDSANNNNLIVTSLNNNNHHHHQEQPLIPITIIAAQHARISMISNSDSFSSEGSNRMSTFSNDTVATTDTSISTTSFDDQDVSLMSNINVEKQQEQKSEKSDHNNHEQDKEQVDFIGVSESESMETKNYESEESNVVIEEEDENDEILSSLELTKEKPRLLVTADLLVASSEEEILSVEDEFDSKSAITTTTDVAVLDQKHHPIIAEEKLMIEDSSTEPIVDEENVKGQQELLTENVVPTEKPIESTKTDQETVNESETSLGISELTSSSENNNIDEVRNHEQFSANIEGDYLLAELIATEYDDLKTTTKDLPLLPKDPDTDNDDDDSEKQLPPIPTEDSTSTNSTTTCSTTSTPEPTLQLPSSLTISDTIIIDPSSSDGPEILTSPIFEDPKLQTFTEELAGVTLAEELLRVTLAEELSRANAAANINNASLVIEKRIPSLSNDKPATSTSSTNITISSTNTITRPSSTLISEEKTTSNSKPMALFSETSSSSGRPYVNVNEEVKKLASVIAEVKQSATLIAAQVKPVQQQCAPSLPTSKSLSMQQQREQQRDRIKQTPNLIAGQNMKLRPLTLLEELEKDSYLSSSTRNSSAHKNNSNISHTKLPSPPISTENSPASTPEPLSRNNNSSSDIPPLPDSPVTTAMTAEFSPPSSRSSTPTTSKTKHHSPRNSQSLKAPSLPPPTSKWHSRSTSSGTQQQSGEKRWPLQKRPSKIVLPSQLTPPTLPIPLSKSAPTTPSSRISSRNHIPPPLPLPPLPARLSPPPLPLPPTSPNSGGGSKIPLPSSSSNSNSRKNSQTPKSPLNSPPATTIPGPFSSTQTKPATPAKINLGSTSTTTTTRNPPPLPLPPASSRITPSPYVLSQQTPRVNPPPLPLPPASPFFVKLKKSAAAASSSTGTNVDETTRPTTPRTLSLRKSEQMISEISENVQEQQRSLFRYTRARAKSLAEGLSKRQVPSFDINSLLPNKIIDSVNSENHEIRRRGSAASDRGWRRPSVAEANSGIPVFSAFAKNNGPSSLLTNDIIDNNTTTNNNNHNHNIVENST